MRRIFGWLLLVIGFCALGFWGQHHAITIENQIKADLQEALPIDIGPDVEVTVSGRDITITGEVASAADRTYLTEIAQTIRGHRDVRNLVQLQNR